ncbi:hypothetical protein [Bordetella sp. BOR01]|uniref:hypothetical protein n=1 Tax=Bordetella sp. BOR01 TaxID=2854779 RepID=UPI001C472BC9|nr:hypothetical protein [Bordetella sp. BOR01]MBV7482804.1 hypothetical protein [Bordetella sp. BOR01]
MKKTRDGNAGWIAAMREARHTDRMGMLGIDNDNYPTAASAPGPRGTAVRAYGCHMDRVASAFANAS